MRTITNQSELAELLFEELEMSEPKQEVNPSFLLRIGGICHGLIYGGLAGEPEYLSDMFAVHSEGRSPTRCGTKLVAFAQSLAINGCFDPARVWSVSSLIEQMMVALDTQDLREMQDHETGECYVTCAPEFAMRRGVTVRVELSQNP
jgi:hypothetical protein